MSRKSIAKNLAYDSERQKYYAVFNGGTDGAGGRMRHTRTFATYEAAMTALREFYGLGGAYLPAPGQCSLRDWLRYWLEEVVARDRAESTVYGYRNIIRCHIVPAIGDTPLRDLSPLLLQNYLYERLDEGLSPNTVRKHHVLLSSALRLAVRQEVLRRNPMERVDPPKKLPSRYTFYTPTQLQVLFAAVEGSTMELAVKLAAYLGLRRSEICGLRWEHVDLDAGVIFICEARTEVGGVVVEKDTKTQSSVRRLGIAGLVDLRELLERQRASRPWTPSDFVLVDEWGQPPRPDYLTARLLKIVRRYNLPKITMHGLRHSFASVANSMGVPMFDISKTLGHASMTVTSTIYTHLFDETQQKALTAVGRAIEGRVAAQ